MEPEDITRRAAELGIPLNEVTLQGLKAAIRRELRGLQGDDLTQFERDRLSVLTGALDATPARTAQAASTDLITIGSKALEGIIRAATAPLRADSNPESAMKQSVFVASTQARKDFRSARTLPFAGFGALVLAAWGFRDSFGAGFTAVGTTAFTIGMALVLFLALGVYWLAHLAQRRDERTLRVLYRLDTQAEALSYVVNELSEFTFLRSDFEHSLFVASVHESRLGREAFRQRPFSRFSALGSLSTVDLPAALDDATDLALARFVKLGTIAPSDTLQMQFTVADESRQDFRRRGLRLDP